MLEGDLFYDFAADIASSWLKPDDQARVKLVQTAEQIYLRPLQALSSEEELIIETSQRITARRLVLSLLAWEFTTAILIHEDLTESILDSGHDGLISPNTWHPDHSYPYLSFI